ncbi:MAG: hypothetical protein RBS80_28960 [Thermoguttaceae bacterium]|jgi:hypothetical protein|nr:hypothetical protein [Thermoguttaceae bacterium]
MSRPVIVVVAFFLLAATAVNAAAAHTIWLEAEQFENIGGWTADAQFIDQMGSPYLLAAGMGMPVEDAVTTIRPRAAGRGRPAPRRFRIDKALGRQYGVIG